MLQVCLFSSVAIPKENYLAPNRQWSLNQILDFLKEKKIMLAQKTDRNQWDLHADEMAELNQYFEILSNYPFANRQEYHLIRQELSWWNLLSQSDHLWKHYRPNVELYQKTLAALKGLEKNIPVEFDLTQKIKYQFWKGWPYLYFIRYVIRDNPVSLLEQDHYLAKSLWLLTDRREVESVEVSLYQGGTYKYTYLVKIKYQDSTEETMILKVYKKHKDKYYWTQEQASSFLFSNPSLKHTPLVGLSKDYVLIERFMNGGKRFPLQKIIDQLIEDGSWQTDRKKFKKILRAMIELFDEMTQVVEPYFMFMDFTLSNFLVEYKDEFQDIHVSRIDFGGGFLIEKPSFIYTTISYLMGYFNQNQKRGQRLIIYEELEEMILGILVEKNKINWLKYYLKANSNREAFLIDMLQKLGFDVDTNFAENQTLKQAA